MANWYALHVRSNFERRVQQALGEFGYENFSPHVNAKSRFGKGGVLQRPLLPGYVFVRLELESPARHGVTPLSMRERWFLENAGVVPHRSPGPPQRIEVTRITGVVRIVGSGEQAEPIPDQEVESLQILLSSGAPVEPVAYAPNSGEEIEITCGPLTGCTGTVMRRRGKVRITVSVEMLGKSVSTEVDAAWLRPARTK